MIIAEIGSTEYLLESIKDAEELLQILNRAVPVRHNWDHELYYYLDERADVARIGIIGGTPLSYEDAQQRMDEEAAARRHKRPAIGEEVPREPLPKAGIPA